MLKPTDTDVNFCDHFIVRIIGSVRLTFESKVCDFDFECSCMLHENTFVRCVFCGLVHTWEEIVKYI